VLAAVKLLRALDRPIIHEGGTAVLRPCVGIATLPEHGFAPADLLMAADVSRHTAATREEGYHVFQAEDAVETQVYRGLDLDLERAIRSNELEVRYQPVVALSSGQPVGAEALLRWNHPQAGEVAPATIVGIAERTGLIGALSFWFLNAALRQAAQWHVAGYGPRLSIDIPVAMLNDRELPAVVDQSLRTWNMPASHVTLEVAESAMIAEAERSCAILTRLKAVGLQIAIDGFGSGSTSLSQLKRCPVDLLKIGAPFVAGMLHDPGDGAVVRSIIDMAHHFGMAASAEGVHSPEVGEALARLGCDFAQGDAVCPPLSDETFLPWWAENIAEDR
jgi:EAL domain-containing protein (putative c-di-GMP-specific phosphodiesterase class I)